MTKYVSESIIYYNFEDPSSWNIRKYLLYKYKIKIGELSVSWYFFSVARAIADNLSSCRCYIL